MPDAAPFTEIDAWYGNDTSGKLTFGKLPAKPLDPYDVDGGFSLIPSASPLPASPPPACQERVS